MSPYKRSISPCPTQLEKIHSLLFRLTLPTTENEVKKACGRVELQFQPDNAGPSGEARMEELNCIYEDIISDML